MVGVCAGGEVDEGSELTEPGAEKGIASVGVKECGGSIATVAVADKSGKGNRMSHEEQPSARARSFGETGANGIRLKAGFLDERFRSMGNVEHVAPAEAGVAACEIILKRGFGAAGDLEIHGTHGEVVVSIAASDGEALEMEVVKVEAMDVSGCCGGEPEALPDVFHAGEFRPLGGRNPVVLIAQADD